MKRIKTFFIYALLVVIVLISTDFIMNLCLNITYRDIKNYKIETSTPTISIKEAKTTNMNGHILGTVTNNSESTMENMYVKVDLQTKRGNTIGTEYFEIENLKPNETQEFNIDYKRNDVNSFTINTVDKQVKEKVELIPLIKDAEIYFPVALLISVAPFYFF